MSDIVGTVVLLAVTVIIVSAATVAFSASGTTKAASPRLDLRANATAGPAGLVTLQHAGGASLLAGEITAVVTSNTWTERVALGAGAFDIGSSVGIAIPRALGAGDRLEVLLYAGSALVGSATLAVSGASASGPAPGTFTMALLDPIPGTTSDVYPGSSIRISAAVAHPDGRRAILRAFADLSDMGGPTEAPLYDDGTRGDATAADGEWGAYVQIPLQAAKGAATIALGANDLDGFSASGVVTIGVDVKESLADIINGQNGRDGDTLEPLAPQVPLNGPQGGAGEDGVDGVPGATLPPGADPMLTISDLSPESGPAGTIVRITGTWLTNVSGITMANEGATEGYSTAFAAPASAPRGTALIFAVPNILYDVSTPANNVYVVTVTRSDGAYKNADETFTLTAAIPEIVSVTPDSAEAYKQVTISGNNFVGTTNVYLSSATWGDFAVPWGVVDDHTISFMTHEGLKPGDYDVTVSNGVFSDTAAVAFTLDSPISPDDVTLIPSTTFVEEQVSVLGANLDSVTRLTLKDATRILDTTWWLDSGTIKFIVPVTAAPPAGDPVEWTVSLGGAFGDPIDVTQPLTVLPSPPPRIDAFTPTSGVPFQQVDIFGANFVNVREVSMNGTALYWAVVSSSHILAITHNGLSPGYYNIIVTTQTGSDGSTPELYRHLRPPIVPVYPPDIFEYVGVYVTKNVSSGSGDEGDVWVKLKTNATVTLGGTTGWSLVTDANCDKNNKPLCSTFSYQPFKPGNLVEVSFGAPVCLDGRTAVFHYKGPLANFEAKQFVLSLFLNIAFTSGGTTTRFVSVTTNDPSQFFNLAPTDSELLVYDHENPTNGSFQNCL